MDRAMHTAPAGPSGMEREFARARRHSALVRTLRVALPALAVAIVAGGVLVTWAARSVPEGVSIESASLDDRGIVMRDPRMSGFDKNNRPYSMVAERAIQALGGGGVDLETVRAKLTVGDSTTADVRADKGHYDPAAEKLRLADSIKVETSDGMTIALETADIDLKAGTLGGGGPVEIVSPTQTIRAGRLDVRDHGAFLTFSNRVAVRIDPPDAAPSPSTFSPGDKTRPRDFSSIELQ